MRAADDCDHSQRVRQMAGVMTLVPDESWKPVDA
jgi:hypothetical protein